MKFYENNSSALIVSAIFTETAKYVVVASEVAAERYDLYEMVKNGDNNLIMQYRECTQIKVVVSIGVVIVDIKLIFSPLLSEKASGVRCVSADNFLAQFLLKKLISVPF